MVRRIVVLAVALALVAAPAVAAATGRLRLADRDPVVVSGRGFKPNERVRVRVRVSAEAVRIKRVTATDGGRFRVRFRNVSAGPCSQVWANARGNKGTTAALGGVMQPDCMTR